MTKAPTIHQCGTQWALKHHGVLLISREEGHAPITLCGRAAINPTSKRFDPDGDDLSCGRCVTSFRKRYAV